MSRIAVVGAGLIGLGCAYELVRRGHDVVVLDRGDPGAGCSAGNLGWIVPSLSAPLPTPGLTAKSLKWMLRPSSPLHIAPSALPEMAGFLWRFWRSCSAVDFAAGLAALAVLNARTIEFFDMWKADGVRFEMHELGLLFTFLDHSLVPATLDDLRALEPYGCTVAEPLDGDAARDLEPALSDEVTAGVFVAAERHVRPESLAAGLAARLTGLGATICSGVEVDALVARNGSIAGLLTGQGQLSADRVVLAAGAHTGRLAASAGVTLHIQAGKGYSLTIPHPTLKLRHPIYMVGRKIGAVSYDDALRVGGTMELSGVNEHLNRRRISGLKRGAAAYLRRAPAWERAAEWVGMRPITPDGLPFIGRLPGLENAWIATGHAMVGVTLTPSTAVLLADLVEGGDGWTDHRPFDPGRFA